VVRSINWPPRSVILGIFCSPWEWIDDGGESATTEDILNWNPKQIIGFLGVLAAHDKMFTLEQLDKMSNLYKMSESRNSEIQFLWYRLGIRCEYAAILEPALSFLTSQGRMKFVRPLYRALHASKIGAQRSVEVFQANKDKYHAICSRLVAKDLMLEQ